MQRWVVVAGRMLWAHWISACAPVVPNPYTLKNKVHCVWVAVPDYTRSPQDGVDYPCTPAHASCLKQKKSDDIKKRMKRLKR